MGRKWDVCIVGAGLTGLSTAADLAKRGARVVLIEARTPGAGASGFHGGQVHPGTARYQHQLERILGPLHARALWDLAEVGRQRLARIGSALGSPRIRWGGCALATSHRDLDELCAHFEIASRCQRRLKSDPLSGWVPVES